METTDYDGVELDVCQVHGVWMDQSELLSITEIERHKPHTFQISDLWRSQERPPVDRARKLKCPKCSSPMKLEFYEGVYMDWCTGDGIWLDSGELKAILNNLRLNPIYVGKAALRLWENKF
jgi:Zn-finger nucleic acid-binding protein